ncbi:MAG: hypothetical protein NZL88_11945, partial [Gaiellaceae bacterium]|nr:hypothetical protein [Gaiellaceae bacterium]
DLVRTMVRNAWGLEAPPTVHDARDDARAAEAAARALDELDELREAVEVSREDVLATLERARVRPTASGERGRVAVLDYARARTRSFEVVFLLGLEEGTFPRRDRSAPLLADELREELGLARRVSSSSRGKRSRRTGCCASRAPSGRR